MSECGCKCYQWGNEEFGNIGNKPDIEYCPTHSAAFELLGALEKISKLDGDCNCATGECFCGTESMEIAKVAIAKARSKEAL